MSWLETYHERAAKIARMSPYSAAHTRAWNELEKDVLARAPWQWEQILAHAERVRDDGAWVLCAMLPLTGDPTTDMLT